MRDNFVVFPKNHVSQADGASVMGTRDFKIFAAAHCKKKQGDNSVGRQLKGAGGRTGAHAKDLIDRDAFLVASAAITIFVAPVQPREEKRLGTRGI